MPRDCFLGGAGSGRPSEASSGASFEVAPVKNRNHYRKLMDMLWIVRSWGDSSAACRAASSSTSATPSSARRGGHAGSAGRRVGTLDGVIPRLCLSCSAGCSRAA